MDPDTSRPTTTSTGHPLPRRGWPRLWALLRRAVTRRCPVCGAWGIFKNWWTLREVCPNCDYRFVREEGYFLGAYAVNLLVAEFIPVALLVLLLVRTDLSWVALEAIIIPLVILLPILFFPFSRMLWMTIDLMANPTEHTERRLRHDQMLRRARDGRSDGIGRESR